MAAAITHLATNPAAWHACQTLQASLVQTDCNPATFEATIQHVVANADTPNNVIHVTPERRHKRTG